MSISTDTLDGRLETLPLAKLMKDYRPAYGEAWGIAFGIIRANRAEWDRVQSLREVLRKDGKFRRAVRLDAEDMWVSNGMHRILAHYLEGSQDIEVEIMGSEWPDSEMVEVTFEASIPLMDNDVAEEALHSFPIGTDWAESDGMGCSGKTYDNWYYWSWDRIDELVAALNQQARRYGFEIFNVRAQPFVPDPAES